MFVSTRARKALLPDLFARFTDVCLDLFRSRIWWNATLNPLHDRVEASLPSRVGREGLPIPYRHEDRHRLALASQHHLLSPFRHPVKRCIELVAGDLNIECRHEPPLRA